MRLNVSLHCPRREAGPPEDGLCHLRVFKMKPLGMSKSFALKGGRREGRRDVGGLSCGVSSVEQQRIFHSEMSIQQKMAWFPGKSTLHSCQNAVENIPFNVEGFKSTTRIFSCKEKPTKPTQWTFSLISLI